MFDQRPTRGITSIRAWKTGPTMFAYADATAPAKAVEIEDQRAEEREMIVLRELLAAFPAFSLEDIAGAYTEADSDVNAAAELLTTRQPTVKSSSVQGVRRNSGAEKNSGVRRQVAEQPAVGSDTLLMEKYGMRVGEIINRDCSKQSNSLLHSMQPAHGGASSYSHNFNVKGVNFGSPIRHGVSWDNGSWDGELMNKEDSNGVSGDGALLGGRKKTKQKGWSGLENEVEVADTTTFCEADVKHLVSRLGDSFQLGMDVVRNVLENLNGDTQKSAWNVRAGLQSFEVLLQMTSSTPPQSPKINSTNTEDGWHFDYDDDTKITGLHSSHYIQDYRTAHKSSTNFPAGSKVDHGNRSNIVKTNVHKDIGDSVVTTRPAPLPAWAHAKPMITPFEHNLADVSLKHGSPEKISEGKYGMDQFKSQLKSCGDFDDYGRHRQTAHEHWRLMDYFFKEAAAAYDRGERYRAFALSEKGKEQKQLAQQADERASQRIFQSKNKGIVNNITIDLHAQHVGEAMNVLKRHLQTLSSIPSVHMLTVITGYGSHSINGRARIKPAVTDFLSRNGIPWEEVNEGCLTIKMMDVRNKELDLSDGE